MECLKRVREMAAKVGINIDFIDESYNILSKYCIVVPQENFLQYEGLTDKRKKLSNLE
jgi:DNA-binding transcriptional regulator YhcF (GntR family)